MQEQTEQGIAEMRQGLAADLATGAKVMQPYYLGLLAEAYGEGGHPEEGLPLLAEALAVMDNTELRYYGAELYRLKGALLLRQVSRMRPSRRPVFIRPSTWPVPNRPGRWSCGPP